jgi:hypothetical protein
MLREPLRLPLAPLLARLELAWVTMGSSRRHRAGDREPAARGPARGSGLAGVLAAYSMCRAGLRKQAAAVTGADKLTPALRCWP